MRLGVVTRLATVTATGLAFGGRSEPAAPQHYLFVAVFVDLALAVALGLVLTARFALGCTVVAFLFARHVDAKNNVTGVAGQLGWSPTCASE